jgi:microsomal dipeptidase-like Zn-dependent dipeptidase
MRRVFAFLCVSGCLYAGFFLAFSASADDIAERAKKLHFSSIVLDRHAGTPQCMLTPAFDLGKRDSEGHVDIPHMREGGLNAQFFSIFISGRIDHVVKLVGPDHVGLGSDFDGADMPQGLGDCSKLPKITEALLREGYKEDDIWKDSGRQYSPSDGTVGKNSKEMQATQ